MSLYHNNMKVLEEHSFELEFENDDRYDQAGEILTTEVDGKLWNLQSQFNPFFSAQKWCDQFEQVSLNTTFAIFGMGDATCLLELAERYPQNTIIIYEPDETVLKKQLSGDIMSKLFQLENSVWLVGKNRERGLCHVVDEMFNFQNGVALNIAEIPNYKKMYPKEYVYFLEKLLVAKNDAIATRNTMVNFELDRGKCYLHNLLDVIGQSTLTGGLRNAFVNQDVTDYPAIIISSGPSLDKNIQELVPYQDYAFLICLDSSIRTAMRYGIVPDMLASVDPFKNPDLFDNEYGNEIPLITHINCNYKIIKKSGGRRFYSSDNEPIEDAIFERFKKSIGAIPSGGTVANNAFSVAYMLGFKTIIMIGQDLAYPNGKAHTADAKAEWEIKEENDKYFYVDGIDGQPVLSEMNMCLYKKWFEEQIVKCTDRVIIDATEGGALIKGSKVMTLKEALREYCPNKRKDFKAIIEQAESFLTSDEQDEIRKIIYDVFEQIPETMELMEKQKTVYDELDKLNRKRKYNTSSFKKCIAKITDFNYKMDNSTVVLLLQLFSKLGDFQVYDKLQEKCESQYEEIKLMVMVGRKLLDTYIEAGKKLQEAWAEINKEL